MTDYSVSSRDVNSICYREGIRETLNGFDWRSTIWFIDPRIIRNWEAPYEDDVITDEKKTEISDRIYAYLLGRGNDPRHIVIAAERPHKVTAASNGFQFKNYSLRSLL